LNIAIDFDDTLTADPVLFRLFIDQARRLGHKVFLVTARRDTDENREEIESFLEHHGIEILTWYTGLQSKVEFMKSKGIKIDVWVDDNPRACALGH
jgi:hypothetical protein